jgi:hypothetical protein
MLVPYEQGQLDGLCAIYCVVNAVKILSNTTKESCEYLFKKIIMFLHSKQNLSSIVIYGLHFKVLGSVLKQIPKHLIHSRIVPFKRRKNITLDEFWNSMTKFLYEPKRVIILGLEGESNHWTLVTSITSKQLNLFDSNSMKKIYRNKCTLNNKITKKRSYKLVPQMTYFLS